ncbi:DUF4386 domain-containing protein [Permianibacter sp. IMCC34836]|uniref:DUF4386 domain-containing protein n=1 Tax=Permianibacter fluminis TaxID=2738515 RepID=UPI00155784FB|nr:DUF4386 domain-containing protein [Permianibacter fluminis]NQD37762.1 DUF4386 domain-containing protein [Permianibacter fluminis]
MTRNTIEASPQRYARLCGAIYLAIILLGGFSEGFITNKLIVPGDAATSAQNIMASPELWTIGAAANLLVVILAIPQLWLEYLLLRPVNKSLVLLSVLFGLISLAVEAISKLFLLLVMPTLTSASYQTAFEPAQLQVLANLAFRSHNVAFNIALIFFAFACLLNGYLIYRSGYLPKLIGALLQLAGLSYLIACLSEFFFPTLANHISPAIFVPILIGEASLCLWLLVKGVNVEKWRVHVGTISAA